MTPTQTDYREYPEQLWRDVNQLEQQISAMESTLRELEKQAAKEKSRQAAKASSEYLPMLLQIAQKGEPFVEVLQADPAVLQKLAAGIKPHLSAPAVITALEGEKCHIIVLNPSPQPSASFILSQFTKAFAGKGGGRVDFAQGVLLEGFHSPDFRSQLENILLQAIGRQK